MIVRTPYRMPRRDTCARGHSMVDAKTRVDHRGIVCRACRTCINENSRARYAAQREAQKRPTVPADVLVEEVLFMRSIGIGEQEIADRLGMRYRVYLHALRRNGLAS